MAFASNSGGGPMADINVTPLVDVMLVLLIIFMITAPLMTHKVTVKLPLATLKQKVDIHVPPVTLTIKANGELYWDDERVNASQLDQQLAVTVQRTPQPMVNVRADANTKYGIINDAVQTVRRAGMRKVGFVSSPERNH
ncbi:MAG TPA: biopolymer transporter ExbD [Arenimonas sp.]|uniref:ExbD/TolR family protein n=1 Tax=Arenimonas sp. TaxID=1872635 RepID=UPI002C7A5117|nr:biopolymer transporter ExbD [Arenimonas sp.]HMB58091.1 biopolymer transporter ExbD [Arenimonas sp.]